ncbi:MAG: hypothetical protein GF350_03455 [Chitinivibrionales bacterium]|nr:hypothetical protein [Chitinivibrionales bacterium]
MKKTRCPAGQVLSACAIGVCIICSCVSPTAVEEDEYPIMIYLDEVEKTNATFSGNPVKVIIMPSDSLYFSDLNWNMGEARFVEYPYAGSEEKYLRMEVELTWPYTPPNFDSAKGMPYDTVFVSVGGEKLRSNVVKVYVSNIPPVIYRIKIGPDTVNTDFEVMEYEVGSTGVCTISVSARDYDDNAAYDVAWYAASDSLDTLRPIEPFTSRLSSRSGTVNYYDVPNTYFRDTVYIQAYDGDGGHSRKTLILYRLEPNASPVVDSVRVGDTVFSGNAAVFRLRKLTLDTLRFTTYAHDFEQDTLTYSWFAWNGTALDAGTADTATYTCLGSNCGDTLRTSVVLDTVKITVTDTRGNSDTAAVQIVHGNFPPVIDSVRLGDTATRHDTVDFRLFQGDTLVLQAYTSDTDPWDTVTTSWTPFSGPGVGLEELGDTAVRYVAKDSTYLDRILVVASDGVFDTNKAIFVDVFNSEPSIDSITVSNSTDTVFAGADSMFAYDANGPDTLTMKLYATESDTLYGDSAGYAWYNGSTAVSSADTARFVCADSTYSDTLSVIVTDTKDGLSIRYISISVTGTVE